MFQRSYLQPLLSRVREPRRFIQVIIGPRQVGKTTLVLQLKEQCRLPARFVSADAIADSNVTWLEQEWEISRTLSRKEGSSLLIIDEIQKIHKWSETVKALWDTDTREKMDVKVFLLGSSRLLLQQGVTESLAGRFESTYMGHWSYSEMEEAFGWTAEEYAWFGGYPGSADLVRDEKRWKNYVQQSLIETSISKDILMLTRVDKPALMRRLFELGCLYSGQVLSYTKMLGQLGDAGNTTTLSHYLELLDTAGLVAGIEKYAGKAIRKRSSSPKFQVHNTALISAQMPEFYGEIKQQPAGWGRIVESAIGAHLLNHALSEGYALNYWREGNEEVDFVLEKKGKLVGLEVKTSGALNTKGMTAFKNHFNPHKILLIGPSGLPWQELLTLNPATLF
ncbi:MAG: ATP-binding protein [Chitinophagaceae bacterium]|nr:ATP-binding protein [Chitinophagaceae bacterium]